MYTSYTSICTRIDTYKNITYNIKLFEANPMNGKIARKKYNPMNLRLVWITEKKQLIVNLGIDNVPGGYWFFWNQ
jgi:hypothetical protein